MKDFFNKNSDAVGICKICNRGLSEESLMIIGNELVCKSGNCSERLSEINEVINFNSKTIRKYKTSKIRIINSLLTGFFGLGFIGFALYLYFERGIAGYIYIGLGVIFLFLTIYNYKYTKSLVVESKTK